MAVVDSHHHYILNEGKSLQDSVWLSVRDPGAGLLPGLLPHADASWASTLIIVPYIYHTSYYL